MCINQKEAVRPDEAQVENTVALDTEDIRDVSGGIKWGTVDGRVRKDDTDSVQKLPVGDSLQKSSGPVVHPID